MFQAEKQFINPVFFCFVFVQVGDNVPSFSKTTILSQCVQKQNDNLF